MYKNQKNLNGFHEYRFLFGHDLKVGTRDYYLLVGFTVQSIIAPIQESDENIFGIIIYQKLRGVIFCRFIKETRTKTLRRTTFVTIE